ncbi:hypothetical protein ABPG75_011222 [Micractinium tetrahymenae]
MTQPLVELRVENSRGSWRKIVVCETTPLFCLHRIIAHAFNPGAQDGRIEKQQHEFTFQGAKLGKAKTLSLSRAPLGEAFLGGKEKLKYAAGNMTYTITAAKRGAGDARHYGARLFCACAGDGGPCMQPGAGCRLGAPLLALHPRLGRCPPGCNKLQAAGAALRHQPRPQQEEEAAARPDCLRYHHQ